MSIKPIQILINAKDNASAVFGSLQAKVAAVGAAIASFFTVRAFTGAVQGAAELQSKLAEVQAVSGATADELEALRAAAESAGATTRFTATEAADALGNLARSGLNANSAIAALPSTLALAQAGNLGLAESSSIMTRALAGFGLEAEQAGRVADVLAKGANSANTTVTGLGQALSFAAPTAVSLGLSLEDTVAIIGKFADAGIDAGRAGTALNSILAQFSDPASKFRKELAAAGITTGDFNTALAQLGNAGPRGQRAILAVGQEAGPALRALLNQGIGSLDELRTALLGAQGAAAATAATMDNNLQGATRGLASAWDTVKNALATPVLPVLQQGITQLADSLRNAVSSGAVGRFGESLARGFAAALEAFRQFIAQVDFQAIGARIEEFVASAGRSFDTLAQYAANAGNSVKLAYGVMSTGVNTVKAAILGIGSVFAEVAGGIMSGVARLREGLATVTFGGLSAGFREAAEDARISAGAFGASAQAMREAAAQALLDVADGAVMARDAWTGLTGAVDRSVSSSSDAATGLGAVAKELERVAEANARARDETEKASATQQEQERAAKAASDALALLRQEYAQLIAKGDLQAAAEKMVEINKALQDTPASAKAAAEAAEKVKAAFRSMGLQTKEELKELALQTRKNYELIKASGQATADVLQAAFRKVLEAEIAASGGVATETQKAQAAMYGLEIVSDSAGKAIVRAMSAGTDEARNLEEQLRKAMLAAQQVDGFVSRLAKRNAEVKSTLVTDSQGFAADERGNTIVAGGNLSTLTGIAAFLKAAGVDDDAAARSIAREFANAQGEVQYFNSPGLRKYGGEFSTISDALLKAAERYTFGRVGVGGAAGAADTSSIPKQSREVTVNVNFNGESLGPVNTDSSGSAVIEELLRRLELGKRSSS